MTALTPAERAEMMDKAYEISKRVHETARKNGVEYVARSYAHRGGAYRSPAPKASQTDVPELTDADKLEIQDAKDLLAGMEAKVTDDDVYANPLFVSAAQLYLSTYTGDFEFLVSMKSDSAIYGFAKWSAGKYRGVLNCMRAEAIRERKETAAKLAAKTAPVAIDTSPVEPTTTVPVGTYTAVFGDGSHTTLRVKKHWLPEEAAKGTTVVQYLSGSDNETSYTGFAFQRDGRLMVWKKFAGLLPRQIEAWAIVSRDPSKAGEGYALHSGNCFRCNRTLTVPLSLHRGLGPECFSKWGS